MDFQEALRARLIAESAVAAIIGARVSWVDRPQKEKLPGLTLQVTADPRPQNLKGFDGARATRVQADCWSLKYGEAVALARAVITAVAAPATINGKTFGNAQVEGQRDLGERIGDGTFVHRQSVDLTIWHAGD